jgi:hypothetical protein
MARLTIDRCIIRVVRRGGWGWGADGRQLVDAIRRLVPALVARHLAECWPDETSASLSTPVRLTLTLPRGELTRAMAAADGPHAPFPPGTDFAVRVEQAVRAAVRQAVAADRPVESTAVIARSRRQERPIDAGSCVRAPLVALLTRWQAEGLLAARARRATAEQLSAWLQSFERGLASDPVAPRRPADAEWTSAVADARALFIGEASPALLGLRAAVVAAVDLVWRLGAMPRGDQLAQVMVGPATAGIDASDSDVPPLIAHVDTRARSASAGADDAVAPALDPSEPHDPLVPAGEPRSRAGHSAGPEVGAPVAARQAGERHIASVLPFLMLGPLARTGYLDALAAAFDAAGRLSDLPLAGAALAYKALGVPARGWRRTPADLWTAITVAGLDAVVPDGDIARASRDVSGHLALADDELTRVLMSGHEHDRPLLLTRTGDPAEGFLLSEIDGLFPIAWRASTRDLATAVEGGHPLTVLIPASAATGDVLSQADAGGWRFITDAPSGRGEAWRALRLPHAPRRWTNDGVTPGPELLRIGEPLLEAADAADASWRALVDRVAVVPRGDWALERSTTLAAGVALADIAWTLWREREPTAPALALERFGDLDARVRFDDDGVHVRMPLGRRHQDLLAHGLLRDVNGVPWLGGRTLRFAGG